MWLTKKGKAEDLTKMAEGADMHARHRWTPIGVRPHADGRWYAAWYVADLLDAVQTLRDRLNTAVRAATQARKEQVYGLYGGEWSESHAVVTADELNDWVDQARAAEGTLKSVVQELLPGPAVGGAGPVSLAAARMTELKTAREEIAAMKADLEGALAVLAPAMPESGVEDAARQRMQELIVRRDNDRELAKAAKAAKMTVDGLQTLVNNYRRAPEGLTRDALVAAVDKCCGEVAEHLRWA